MLFDTLLQRRRGVIKQKIAPAAVLQEVRKLPGCLSEMQEPQQPCQQWRSKVNIKNHGVRREARGYVEHSGGGGVAGAHWPGGTKGSHREKRRWVWQRGLCEIQIESHSHTASADAVTGSDLQELAREDILAELGVTSIQVCGATHVASVYTNASATVEVHAWPTTVTHPFRVEESDPDL